MDLERSCRRVYFQGSDFLHLVVWLVLLIVIVVTGAILSLLLI